MAPKAVFFINGLLEDNTGKLQLDKSKPASDLQLVATVRWVSGEIYWAFKTPISGLRPQSLTGGSFCNFSWSFALEDQFAVRFLEIVDMPP